ncbi:hypothetical protein GRF29_96g1150903 [Pseudopithomyces chartarum]|uniref:RRM domain-containing protein n=1 Tax=Pseudopithomyces chartarum TaxID=1892770 RepID=A0AAN6LYI0_9PLEO|nr:hypothetical protein GRF29_96g1150903 [Pseudopithomyces chartarum]
MASRDNQNLHPHPSLPARPPPPTYSAPPVRNNNAAARPYAAYPSPSVVAQAPPSHLSAPPTMYSQPSVSAPYTAPAYPSSNAYYNSYPAYGTQPSPAAYAPPTAVNHLRANYDPEEEARIAEWGSAYTREDAGARKPANSTAATRADANLTPDAEAGSTGTAKQKTVVREGGGKTWEDQSLLEWDPLHPRLFIGNLAGEVTDDSLLKAFSKYPSVSKARVVRDKRTTKSKSYGFVSFANTDDYFRAAKEMQGKYIGSHPVLIKRATSEVKAVTKRDDKHGKQGKNRNNNNNNYKKQHQQQNGGNAAFTGTAQLMSAGIHKKGKNSGPRMLG